MKRRIKADLLKILEAPGLTKCQKDALENLIKALKTSKARFIVQLWFCESFLKDYLRDHKIIIPQEIIDYLMKTPNADLEKQNSVPYLKTFLLLLNYEGECYYDSINNLMEKYRNKTLKPLVS